MRSLFHIVLACGAGLLPMGSGSQAFSAVQMPPQTHAGEAEQSSGRTELRTRSGKVQLISAQEVQMSEISAAVILKAGNTSRDAGAGFKRLGFEVQIIDTLSLLLIAKPVVFEKTFGKLVVDDAGPRLQSGEGDGRQLPVSALPPALADQISQMELSAPPDFGPTDF